MNSEQLCSALVSWTSERTDLGFTRDRHLKMRKSGKPDLGVGAKIRDPAVPDASQSNIARRESCVGSRVSFRHASLARDTRIIVGAA
jgi:hypothetical protein